MLINLPFAQHCADEESEDFREKGPTQIHRTGAGAQIRPNLLSPVQYSEAESEELSLNPIPLTGCVSSRKLLPYFVPVFSLAKWK